MRHNDRTDVLSRQPLRLTPMIDVVFLLLVFFIFTFKIAAREGDFRVSTARAGISAEVAPQMPPLVVRLRADQEGELIAVELNGRVLSREHPFQQLHSEVRALVGACGGLDAGGLEVELTPDPQLKHRYLIDAVTAVSGYRDQQSGRIVPLVENIRLSSPQ